jgi:hypothetical protein
MAEHEHVRAGVDESVAVAAAAPIRAGINGRVYVDATLIAST